MTTPVLNDGFILDVDEAMKDKCRGILVDDQKASTDRREADVYYRMPDRAITERTFPYLTVDLLRIERAADREQRGENVLIPYVPKGYPDVEVEDQYTADMPIPMNFIYQITSHARYAQHDRQIWFQMLQNDRFPPRGAYLVVPPTYRQMFVSGPVDLSDMEPSPGGVPKRLFRKAWTASVTGELFQSDIVTLSKITEVDITLVNMLDVVSS